MAKLRVDVIAGVGTTSAGPVFQGEVEFNSVKACERCILTTVNTERGTLRESKEPLKTLQQKS